MNAHQRRINRRKDSRLVGNLYPHQRRLLKAFTKQRTATVTIRSNRVGLASLHLIASKGKVRPQRRLE